MSKIEELENKIAQLKKKKHDLEALAKIQDVFQHSYKIYLNSVYGFTGTQYSPVFSVDLAEAVTSTGRMTIQQMVRFTNKALTKIDAGSTGITQYVTAGDTDSVSCSLLTTQGKTTEEIFNKYYDKFPVITSENGNERIDLEDSFKLMNMNDKHEYTYSLNGKTQIKSISRHKVNKDKWKISIDDTDIEITSDHSIMVYRNGEIIECKPNEILETDYLLKRKNK